MCQTGVGGKSWAPVDQNNVFRDEEGDIFTPRDDAFVKFVQDKPSPWIDLLIQADLYGRPWFGRGLALSDCLLNDCVNE